MKKVVFNGLLLLSHVLKKARYIKFGEVTLITGTENTTGKSSILKSLYSTLGADVKFEDEWIPLQVKSVLLFSLNDERFIALRDGDHISFFDSNNSLIITTNSITKELSPFISQIFDFELPLMLKSNASQQQAIPAFLYLPFYIDQDNGWTTYFSSFIGLGMYNRWQKTFKEYHTGIKPKEYYELSNKIGDMAKELSLLKNEEELLNKTREKVGNSLHELKVEIDIDAFRERLESLLANYNSLKSVEDELRKTLYQLNDVKIDIENQIDELKEQVLENNKELELSKESTSVVCSKCGSTHESKLYNEYVLLSDTNNAIEFISEMEKNLTEVNEMIEEEVGKYDDAKRLSKEIQSEITEVKSEISLNDIVEARAKDHAEKVFINEIDGNSEKQEAVILRISGLEDDRKRLCDKKRISTIRDQYLSYLGRYLNQLSIDSSHLKPYRANFTPPDSLLKTGSRGPRQMLAVYFAFVNTVYQFSTTAKFPVVVDSPKQQEQDSMNAEVIGKFCIENKPTESQLILATLNFGGEKKGILVHEFNDKKGLLNEADYQAYLPMFSALVEKLIPSQQ